MAVGRSFQEESQLGEKAKIATHNGAFCENVEAIWKAVSRVILARAAGEGGDAVAG